MPDAPIDNTNPQPDNSSIQQKINAKELLDSLRLKLKLEGDYRDLLKDSINDLNNQIKAYDKINGRIETLNRSTINIKDIEKDLKKLREDRYVTGLKMRELEMKMGVTAEEATKRAEKYNQIIDAKSKKDIQINQLTGEANKLQDELLKKQKDGPKLAQDYVHSLIQQREAQTDLIEAQRSGDQSRIKVAKENLEYQSDFLKELENTMSVEARALASKIDQVTKVEQQSKILEKQIQIRTTTANQEELAYAQALKSKELQEKQVEKTKEKLEFENRVKDNLGISGNLLGVISEKLGLGGDAYSAMVEKSRELEETSQLRLDLQEKINDAVKQGNTLLAKSLTSQLNALPQTQSSLGKTFSVMKAGFKAVPGPALFAAAAVGVYKLAEAGLNAVGNAAKTAGNFFAGLSEHSTNFTRNLLAPITGFIEKIPLVGGFMSGLIQGAAAIVDLILGVDDYAVKVGRSIGLGTEESRKMRVHYSNIARAAGVVNEESVAVTEKLMDSNAELAKMLGFNRNINDQTVLTNQFLKERLGLDAESRKYLAETNAITGKQSEKVLTNFIGTFEYLRKTTGISINWREQLSKAANFSGFLGLQFAKYPDKMAKTLMLTSAMGADLQKLNGIADGFLDFESSISKEFEAQVLTGRDINLNAIRNAALNNDQVAMAEELMKITGGTEKFLSMNRIQQQSLAAAANMTVDEMSNYLKQQEKLKIFNVKNEKDLNEKIKLLRQGNNLAEEENIIRQMGAAEYEKLKQGSMLEDFEGLVNRIKGMIVDLFANSNLMPKLQEAFKWMSNKENIQTIMKELKDGTAWFVEKLGQGLKLITDVVAGILEAVYGLPSWLGGGKDTTQNLINHVNYVGKSIEIAANNMAQNMRESGLEDKDKTAEQPGLGNFKDFSNKANYERAIEGTAEYRAVQYLEELNKGNWFQANWRATQSMYNWLFGDSIEEVQAKYGMTNQNTEPHAMGGLFNRPTKMFDQSGNTHMFGEAGKEALIPLQNDYAISQISDALVRAMPKNNQTQIARNENQTNEQDRPIEVVIHSTLKGIYDDVIGQATERFEAHTSRKRERSTGVAIPTGGWV